MGNKGIANPDLLAFVDQSAHLDRRLAVIADLCVCCANNSSLMSDSITGIGEAIFHYLDRRTALEKTLLKQLAKRTAPRKRVGRTRRSTKKRPHV
jgi:hypothetical protein